MIVDTGAKSLEEQVFNSLEEEILTGKLKRGDTLAEISLSKRLGVSRTPLRAALHRLAEEGLIEIPTNRSAVVIGVGRNELVDIYKIRMRLEGLASREAATRISDEDKKKLRDSVELSEFYIGKQDTEHLKELDTTFHSIIFKASDNRMLCKILSELHRNIKAYRKLSLTVPGRLEKSIEEHKEILGAIEKRDASLADSLASLHIEKAAENIISAINNQN